MNYDRMSYLNRLMAKTRHTRRAGIAAVVAFGLFVGIVVLANREDETSVAPVGDLRRC